MRQFTNSQHILKLEEVHETRRSVYLVLELLEGGELFGFKRKFKRLAEEDIKFIMKNILQGLVELHSKGYIHRDIKPENIIYKQKNNDDSIKIVDFGFATKANTTEQLFRRCGTPGYMAPEIIMLEDNDTYDEKCDVFSAGVIFYTL